MTSTTKQSYSELETRGARGERGSRIATAIIRNLAQNIRDKNCRTHHLRGRRHDGRRPNFRVSVCERIRGSFE
ncbi:Protein of unknown function [Pyronema omphalodes CBS 100304]|uniref:Uncharacterized protein n=1 Tax=Pyronema omphalodes (strain CBS 100304) TaxID=1076935 RepID=U4LNT3_PYROM|nr:Protein of unknown function [Pyronema omphalodes CBS 100304]